MSYEQAYSLGKVRLRAMRERMGLKQKDVGEICGVPQSYVSKWEKQEYFIPLERFRLLFKAFALKLTEVDPDMAIGSRLKVALDGLKDLAVDDFKPTRKTPVHARSVMTPAQFESLAMDYLSVGTINKLAQVMEMHVQTVYRLLDGKSAITRDHVCTLLCNTGFRDVASMVRINPHLQDRELLKHVAYAVMHTEKATVDLDSRSGNEFMRVVTQGDVQLTNTNDSNNSVNGMSNPYSAASLRARFGKP